VEVHRRRPGGPNVKIAILIDVAHGYRHNVPGDVERYRVRRARWAKFERP